jgi:hypothetical protein
MFVNLRDWVRRRDQTNRRRMSQKLSIDASQNNMICSAQSYNAPAGIPAVTAPGGLVGIAGQGNVERYLDRDGRHGTVSVRGSRLLQCVRSCRQSPRLGSAPRSNQPTPHVPETEHRCLAKV